MHHRAQFSGQLPRQASGILGPDQGTGPAGPPVQCPHFVAATFKVLAKSPAQKAGGSGDEHAQGYPRDLTAGM